MKNSLYSTFILFGIAVLLFGACAPKYGAHFNQSSNFYEPAVASKEETPKILEKKSAAQEIDASKLTASKEPVKVHPLPTVRELVEKYEAKAEEIKSQNLSKKEERKALKKETRKVKKKIRKEIKKEVKALKRQDAGDDYVVMMILAIIIPPLGVGLTYGITGEFWLSLILTLIFWLPGAIYSAIVVHNYFRG